MGDLLYLTKYMRWYKEFHPLNNNFFACHFLVKSLILVMSAKKLTYQIVTGAKNWLIFSLWKIQLKICLGFPFFLLFFFLQVLGFPTFSGELAWIGLRWHCLTYHYVISRKYTNANTNLNHTYIWQGIRALMFLFSMGQSLN